jgi:hypothetical protein
MLSGSTIESVLENVMFSGLSGMLDEMISRSSEGHGMPADRVKSDDAARHAKRGNGIGWARPWSSAGRHSRRSRAP